MNKCIEGPSTDEAWEGARMLCGNGSPQVPQTQDFRAPLLSTI